MPVAEDLSTGPVLAEANSPDVGDDAQQQCRRESAARQRWSVDEPSCGRGGRLSSEAGEANEHAVRWVVRMVTKRASRQPCGKRATNGEAGGRERVGEVSLRPLL